MIPGHCERKTLLQCAEGGGPGSLLWEPVSNAGTFQHPQKTGPAEL